MAERHDRIGSEVLHVDANLSERLRRVDDRDRPRVAREPARLADGQHVARLARHRRYEKRTRAVAHAQANLVEESVRIAMPPDLAKLVAELGAPAQRIERASV